MNGDKPIKYRGPGPNPDDLKHGGPFGKPYVEPGEYTAISIPFSAIPERHIRGDAGEDISPLVDALMGDDEARQYIDRQGKSYFQPDGVGRCGGYTSIECLQDLVGLPFNNLVMAYVRALRPSLVRVVPHGSAVTSDGRCWRVTIMLTADNRVAKIEQEVEIGYGCGADVGAVLRAVKEGREPPRVVASGTVIGHTAAIARADFT